MVDLRASIWEWLESHLCSGDVVLLVLEASSPLSLVLPAFLVVYTSDRSRTLSINAERYHNVCQGVVVEVQGGNAQLFDNEALDIV